MKKHLLKFLLTFVLSLLFQIGWAQYSGTGTFTKITTLGELESGAYYVFYGINSTYTGAMTNTISGGRMGSTSVTPSGDDIIDPPASIVWLVEGNATDGYTVFNEAESKYVEIMVSSTSGFSFNSTSSHEYDVTVDAEEFSFATNHVDGGGRCISIYQTDWRPYTSPNTLNLYKLPAGPDTDPPVATWDPIDAATDIAITTDITITFDEAIQNIDDSEITDLNVASLLTLKETDGSGSDVAFTATIDVTKKVITIDPDADLANNQVYYVAIAAVEDANDNATTGENITFTTAAAKAQPTNHVTGFTATVNSYNHISLTWTDAAAGTQEPDAYLIKASTGSITAPEDGTDPAEDTDLSDGDAVVKVLYAADDSIAFENLLPGTTYNFQIWSYTNEGTSIDYKLDVAGPDDNATTGTTELFFTEYIEGSSNNKAVEIYNGTGSDVDLSSYVVNTYSGGATTPNYSESLTGTLTNGEVFVITNASANTEIDAESDITSSITFYNGDDAVALLKNGIVVDVVGTVGEDPGSAWDVAGTTGATAEHTLIRKIGRTYGNTDWTSSAGTTEGDSEWIVLPQDNSNNLGTYRDVERDTTLATLTVDAGTLTPAFDAAVTEYTVELPYGTSAVPTVSATVSGTYASEVTVQATNVDGTEGERTATVTVTGDDSGTKVYSVVFSVALNNDATLSNLTVSEGTLVPVFDAATEDYTVELPYGTSLTPTTTATENDPNANAVVTDATDVTSTTVADRTTTVVVTAEDGSTTKTYTIVFSVAPNNDATLSDLTTDMGTLVPAFDAATVDYTVELPYGTTTEPVVGATENDPNANAVITQVTDIEGNEAARTATVVVTAEDGTTTKTYTIVYSIAAASTDATLSDLTVSQGSLVPAFEATTYAYTVELPYGTTDTPTATPTTNDPNANADVTNATNVTSATVADRTTTIAVTAEDGSTTQDYTIVFNVAANDAKQLTAFSIVDPAVTGDITEADKTVAVTVPYGTNVTALIATFSITGQEVKVGAVTQTSGVTANDFTNPVVYTVVAADASTVDYTVTVTITAPNTDATLSALSVSSGTLVPAFDATTEDYTVTLPYGTTEEPVVSATATDANANVDITQATDVQGTLAERTATILVTAEDGTTTKTYTIVFDDEDNDDATLSSLTIDNGTLVPAFDAATYTYNVTLPAGTAVVPTVTATPADANANAVVTPATNLDGTEAERTTTVVVTAEDGSTELTYSVIFELEPEGELFFSEYIEPDGGNNKALEIYNPTSSAVDLHDYVIRINSNGSEWTSFMDFPVGTSVASKDVYVITHADAIAELLAVTDTAIVNPYGDGTSYVAVFNGDDVRALCKVSGSDTTIIDIIGRYDQVDPGSGWPVAGVDNGTSNHTLIRKNSVIEGNTDWDASAGTNAEDSEWIVKDANYFDDLGTHGPKSGTDIVMYSFAEQTGPADIDDVNHTIDIEVAFETPVTALVAEFTLSDGASAEVGAVAQVSGTTANDFSSPVTYTITAEDGSTQDWVVTVTVASTQSSAKEITSFTVEGIIGTATIESAAATVDATVEYATDITSLKPTFEISALATISDTTAAKDFTNAQTYTVTAEDGTEKVWTVTLVKPEPTELTIYDIQYTTGTGASEHVGEFVKTSGIVTAAYSSGYFIQDEGAAWHGLFINDYDNEPSVGDSVEVVGEVNEYQDHTELTDIAGYEVLNTGLDVFDPIAISTADAALEQYEGVLVSVTEAECTVEPNQYNVWTVDDGSGAVNVDDNIYGYTPTLEAVYDVTGIMHGWYGTVLLPRSASDINTYPVIGDITIDPTTPTSAEAVTVSATVTDAETGASGLTVKLFYGSAQGSEDTEVTCAQVGTTDEFEGTVPASSNDVYYKVTASDGSATTTATSNYSVTVTGITNPDGIVSMNIFPNPSNGLFTLEMNASKAGSFDVQIINIQGQVVYSKEINQDGFYKDQIDISNVAIGIYYIRITDGKNTKVSKIMIQ